MPDPAGDEDAPGEAVPVGGRGHVDRAQHRTTAEHEHVDGVEGILSQRRHVPAREPRSDPVQVEPRLGADARGRALSLTVHRCTVALADRSGRGAT